MKRIYKLLLLAFVGSLVLVACGEETNQPPSSFDDAVEMVDVAQEEDLTNRDAEEGTQVTDPENTDITDPSEEEPVEQQRYLIYTAHIDFESLNYDEARQEIEALIQEFEAATQYVNESQYEPYNQSTSEALPMMRYLNATYRIPQEEFEEVMSRLLSIEGADVISSTQGSEDATRSVMDLDIRIQAAEDRLERLNQLLDQAEEIEDILAIQAEVENAIIERDQYLAQRSNITNQAAMSTVTLSLREVYMTQVEESEAFSFSNRVQTTFRNAITGTRRLFQELVLLLISMIPILVLAAILFLIYWILIRPIVKRRRKNRPAKDDQDKNRKRKVPSFAPAKRKADKDAEAGERPEKEKTTSKKQTTVRTVEADSAKPVMKKPSGKKNSKVASTKEQAIKPVETSPTQSDDKAKDDENFKVEKKNKSRIIDQAVLDPDHPDPTTLNSPNNKEDIKNHPLEENNDTPENPS